MATYRIFLSIVLSLSCIAPVRIFAQTSTPIIVELFTSEGCSSCPPADTLLRTLDTMQPVSGVQLIVLGEHVDYWDDLGWKDSFSSHAFTVRQSAYANRLRLASSYTPQMVVDGTFECLGSDRGRANQAFEKARAVPKITVDLSDMKVDGGKISAHLQTGILPPGAEIFVALALEHAQSQVLRGENGGHRLEHVAVVQDIAKVGKAAKGQAFSKDVSVSSRLANQAYRLIAFIQEANQGRILGAAMAKVN